MRVAFTLIELLLASVLASLVFFYLYGTINNLKLQNAPYEQKVESISKESKTFELIFKDFVQHRGKIEVASGKRYDFVKLQTINSLHNIYQPKVYYFVSKKNNALIRVESPKDIDIQNDLWGEIYFSDIVLENIISFKVKHHNDFLNLMIRGENLSPIVLKVFVGE